MHLRLSIALTACLLVFSPWLGHAHAQEMETREGIALQNQIYQLQQEIESLRQQGPSRGGGSSLGGYSEREATAPRGGSNDLVAQLLSRVDTLEDEVRDLRGRIDELQNQTQQQSADMSKQLDDLKFQMQNGGRGGNGGPPPGDADAAPSEAPPPEGPMTSPPPRDLGALSAQPPAGYQPDQPLPLTPQPPRPPSPPVQRTPEVAMHAGFAALAERNYQAAEAAARDVLNNHRTSPRAYDAQFLLAQALTGEHQYSQAAIAYDDAYNRNRKGVHAGPALIGLANSLASINEKRAACETLVKLRAEFPQSAEQLRPQIASVRQRAGCQ
jgi:TolA-binding protein